MRLRRERPHTVPPWCCAHPRAWRAYSPYDRGIKANVAAFCAGTRSTMPAWQGEDPLSPAEDVEAPSECSHHDHDHGHGGHSHGVHRGLLGSARDTYSDAD